MARPRPAPLLTRLWTPPYIGTLVAAFVAFYLNYSGTTIEIDLSTTAERWRGVSQVIQTVPASLYVLIASFLVGFAVVKAVDVFRWRALKRLYAYQGWIDQPHSYKTKAWALLVQVCRGPGPWSTYQFQKVIPHQPLPALEHTIERYLNVVKPLLTSEEFETTKELAYDLKANEGPKLQAHLEKLAATKSSWLADYWLSAIYLAGRAPLAGYNNYYMGSEHKLTTKPLVRASIVIHILTQYEKWIRTERVQPVFIQNLVPLCMTGFRFIFNTCRLPGEHMDTLVGHSGQTHIVVIRKGKYYKLDLYARTEEGVHLQLTREEIKKQLQLIWDMAEDDSPGCSIAALTSQNRSLWAKQRQLLLGNKVNKKSLETIESAMFMVTLDEYIPKDLADTSKLGLLGNGQDRWFDKCFTQAFYGNAFMTSNIEHSMVDGTNFNFMMEDVNVWESDYMDPETGDLKPDVCRAVRKLRAPERLHWDITGMEPMIEQAMSDFNKMYNNLDAHVCNAVYGKGFMKKMRLSPDGYIQMALQLAYYRMHKEIPKTYEPSTGRLFLLGRTETLHPGSAQSVAWVKAMDDQTTDKSRTKDLLKTAIKNQTQSRLNATVGRGCDRHLFGLICAARETGMDLPQLFLDKAWNIPFRLSTTQTPTRVYERGSKLCWNTAGGGFGAPYVDGYGIAYLVAGDDVVNLNINSWHACPTTSSSKFAAQFNKALEDMRTLLQ